MPGNSLDISQHSVVLPTNHAETRLFPFMSRDEVEGTIAEGHQVVIFQQYVLKVDSWLKYHPGGDKAILHMVGRDATDEIDVLHSKEAKAKMLRYCIGRIKGTWRNFRAPIQGGTFRTKEQIQEEKATERGSYLDTCCPKPRTSSTIFYANEHCIRRRQDIKEPIRSRTVPILPNSMVEGDMDGISYLDAITHEHILLDGEKYPSVDKNTQAHIVAKYRDLHQRIVDAGLYKTNYVAYGVECCRYTLCFGMMFLALNLGHYAIGGAFLGFMWHQLVFAAHDAGHMGISHNYHVDSLIAIIIADFLGGVSIGWWKNNHNVHHIMTNAPEHDPDIEHMPLFAVSHRLLGNLRSTFYDRVMKYDMVAKVCLRIQPWTYYPLLALGRFNLYFLSWDHLIAGRGPRDGPAARYRWFELLGQIFFWLWFGYGIVYKMIPDGWSRFVFVMVSHIASSPLHVQIVLSHFAMSTADLGPQESFAQKMLRTTMDIDCPPWLDFIHGGLQFQVIHHLFPRLPRHNLRQAQRFVQEFCSDVGIPYAYYGFANSNKQVIGKLEEVSRQAAILAKCRQTIAKSGDFDGHHH